MVQTHATRPLTGLLRTRINRLAHMNKPCTMKRVLRLCCWSRCRPPVMLTLVDKLEAEPS